MSCKLEAAIWSHDTGQQKPYFDRCQLIITWMSNIKEVHGKPRLHVSVNLLLEYGRHVARLHRRRRRRRREYAPTSNTVSHGTHEKINSWVSFSSLILVWGSAWHPSAAGAPLLIYFVSMSGISPKCQGFQNTVPICACLIANESSRPGWLLIAELRRPKAAKRSPIPILGN